MAKVGVITFSDGRPPVHQELLSMNLQFQNNLVKKLEEAGHEVVVADELPGLMKPQCRRGKNAIK